MSENKVVFLAGATGAIGCRIIPLLQQAGWSIIAGTRSEAKLGDLERIGVIPALGDAFDANCMDEIIRHHRPSLVMHQLTDLPDGLDPAQMDEAKIRNARLRDIGTHNLVAASVRHGVRRFVAQSIAFAYAPGPRPFLEESPLDPTATGVIRLETQVLLAPFEGVVLRYGRLYGPKTGFDLPSGRAPVHVDAAAFAAALAADNGAPGVYNVAESDGEVSSQKAETQLDWSSAFRLVEIR